MRLTFKDAAVRKSKMLFSTNGSTAQTFTITPRLGTTPLTSGVTYAVTEPAGYTGPITLDSATGAVSFGREVYDKVTRSRTPERVTVQATHQGKTASYTFTVTDHFSPRRGHTSVVVGPNIYVIGGNTQSGPDNEVWRSPDGGETWDRLAPSAPTKRFSPRYSHSSAVLGNTIYVIGGGTNAAATVADVVWRSEGGADWTQMPAAAAAADRLAARFEHRSVVLGNEMYVINGSVITTAAGVSNTRDVRRSRDGTTWANVAITLPADGGAPFPPRSKFAMEVLDNAIYIMGGTTVASRTGDDVLESSNGALWTQVDTSGNRFTERQRHSSAVLGGVLYVIGGIEFASPIREREDIWRSADKGRRWTQVAANAQVLGRSWHTSPVLGDAIYVIGGSKKTGGLQNDVWKSTDGGVTWQNVHQNP